MAGASSPQMLCQALRLRLTWGCVAASPCAAAGGGVVAESCPALVIARTVARQSSLSMGFSRQEYWSGLPFPSPGNFPNPGIKSESPFVSFIGRHILYH